MFSRTKSRYLLCNRARISAEIYRSLYIIRIHGNYKCYYHFKCMHDKIMKPRTVNCIDFEVITGLSVIKR